MTGEPTVPIHIIGEVPQEKLQELVLHMGNVGLQVVSGGELDVISPSILVEYLNGPQGLPVPTVTKETVQEFLVSEDNSTPRGSEVRAYGFTHTLMMHTIHHHAHSRFANGEARNYAGRPCRGCDCPLQLVRERKWGQLFYAGITPQSLIEFSKLSFEEAVQKFADASYDIRLGQKRYELIQTIARRLQSDYEAITC